MRTLKMLKDFPSFGPKWFHKILEKRSPIPGFDFQEYVREVELRHYIATKMWGWNHRDYSDKNLTEFARIYRKLNFMWAQAVLRNHIINELNALVKRLGIEAVISVVGLRQPDEILKIREAVTDSTMSFEEAYQKGINTEF